MTKIKSGSTQTSPRSPQKHVLFPCGYKHQQHDMCVDFFLHLKFFYVVFFLKVYKYIGQYNKVGIFEKGSLIQIF